MPDDPNDALRLNLARALNGMAPMNTAPAIGGMRNLPPNPMPNPSGGAAPNADFMGIRGSMQPPGAPPVADMQFTATPHLFNPNAAQDQAALADRAFHNDQPLNKPAANFGEPGTDPFASYDTEQAINRFAPKPAPNIQHLMQMLARGQGTEA